MNRSGYSDDIDPAALNLWSGAVYRAINGRRGQAMLREMIAALDALPEKRLAANAFTNEAGEVCALGAVARARGTDLTMFNLENDKDLEYWQVKELATVLGVAHAFAAEVMFENDEGVQSHVYEKRELCGPVRPHFPDYGSHTRVLWEERPHAGTRQRSAGRTCARGQRAVCYETSRRTDAG
jgi:hypothetical protein